jgi:hypothetical protein
MPYKGYLSCTRKRIKDIERNVNDNAKYFRVLLFRAMVIIHIMRAIALDIVTKEIDNAIFHIIRLLMISRMNIRLKTKQA